MNPSGGTITVYLKLDDKQYKAALAQAERETGNFASKSTQATSFAGRGFENLSKVSMAGVIAAAVAVGAAITKNIGNAVSRVDTLNNFPRVMANLGFGADEARTAINKLDQGVRGLPTSLNQIANGLQKIAPSSKTLDDATNLALAFNNALLAGGQSVELQSTAFEQFSQAVSKGKPDMIEWRSIATAIPGQLDQISQSLGYGRGEWQKMAKDVSEGVLPFDKVKEAIVKLNNDGLGELPSFAQQAKNATGGLSTAIANANTAIARGIANVIQAFGSGAVANAISSFGVQIEKALKGVQAAIINLRKFLGENEAAVFALKGAVLGLAVALGVALIPILTTVAGFLASAAVAAAPFVAAGIAIGLVAFVIKKNWDRVAPVIERVKQAFVDFFNATKPVRDFVGQQLKTAFESIISIGKQIGESLKPIIDALKQVLANKTVQAVLKGIGIALLAIVAAPVVAFFAGLIAALTIVSKVLQFVANHFQTIKKVVLTAIAVAFAPLIATVFIAIKAFQLIVAAAKGILNAFKTIFSAIAAVVTTVFGAIAAVWFAVLKPVFDAIFYILRSLFTIFFTIFTGIFQVVFTIVSTLAQILFVIFQGIFNFIVNTFLRPIFNFYKSVFTSIYNTTVSIVTAVFNVISSIFRAIYNVVAPIVRSVFNVVSSIFSAIYNTVAGIVRAVFNTVSSVFNSVKNTVVNALKSALNGISGLFKSFVNAGKNIIDGIVEGIGNAKDAVVNKVKEICKGALDSVKKFFGISSPSKVMAGIGDNLMGGLVKGVSRTGGAAVSAVRGVSQDILGTVNNLTSSGFGELAIDANSTGAVGANPSIVQNNNIYNQVDLDVVTRELAWQVRR